MLTLSPAHVEVKPAPTAMFAPIIATLVDVADLLEETGPADDSPLWDEWAAEAACMDLMEAGIATW